MAVKIWSYKPGSKSALSLAEAAGGRVLRHEGSHYKGRARDLIINWGSSELPGHIDPNMGFQGTVLNRPEKVAIAANKLAFFKAVNPEISVPWTEDKAVAQEWMEHKHTVVVRKSLTSSKGHGIIIVENGEAVPDAPLYTRYIKKDSEWRIHVFDGEIIFEQRKVRDPEREPVTWKIRSHDNGFIFQHNNLQVPDRVKEVALQAVKEVGLDFGGVDVIANKKGDKAWVLEVNTAVGLEGLTVEKYRDAIRKVLE